MNIAIGYIKRAPNDRTHGGPHLSEGKSRSAGGLIIYLGITDIRGLRMTLKEFAARARSGHIESSLRA
jgi:hypothetical protein